MREAMADPEDEGLCFFTPPPLSAEALRRRAAKAAFLGSVGAKKQALRCFDVPETYEHTPSQARRLAFERKTPPGPCVPEELTRDVPDVAPFKLQVSTFDKVVPNLPRARLGGALYSSYEMIIDLYMFGARTALYTFFGVLCAGALSMAFRPRLAILLAILILKADGSDRPVGVGCALRRCSGRLIVQQDRAAINRFYTEPDPKAVEAQRAEVANATAVLERARAAAAESECAAASEEVRRADHHLQQVSAPRPFPINFVFDSDGAQRFALSTALYLAKHPSHCGGNDDVFNMYNESSRLASFASARRRRPSHVPYHRYFYAHQAEIILVRSEGRMLSSLVVEGAPDGDAEAYSKLASNPDIEHHLSELGYEGEGLVVRVREVLATWTDARFVDSSVGPAQGDPVATDFCCCPTHEVAQEVQEYSPSTTMFYLADDGVYCDAPLAFLRAFAFKRARAREVLRHVTAEAKLKFWVPAAARPLIPFELQHAIVDVLKLGGLFIGDDAACSAALLALVQKKLACVDNLDMVKDTLGVRNASQLRFEMLRDCAAAVPCYWMRAMPPAVTEAAAVWAKGRLRQSFESLARAEVTPEARRDAVLPAIFLPENKGGHGLPDHVAMRDPSWVGFFLRSWAPLKARLPFLASESLVGSTLAPVVAMRASLATLGAEHDTNLRRNATYAADLYHRLDGEMVRRFNPASLPPKRAIHSLAELDAQLQSSISIYRPPAPRKLSEIRRHTKYHEHCARLEAFDATVDAAVNATVGATARAVRERERTRFVSCSQPLAGAWKQDSKPIDSPLFVRTLQFVSGLFISDMYHANVELEGMGKAANWLGDHASEVPLAAGARSTRHHGVNNAWVAAAKAGLPTPVSVCWKGPKQDAAARARAGEAHADLNEGHIPDWGARKAARDGRHLVGETKCYDPHIVRSSGAGSRGGVAMMGATRAFGNTEEMLIKLNYGLAERGVGSAEVFNHLTGAGHVAEYKGAYHDCVHVKGNTMLLLISEIYGGVNGRGVRLLTRLAHSARTCSEDVYFDRAGRVVSFWVHHSREISRAAVLGHGIVLERVVDDVNARAARARAEVHDRARAAAAATGVTVVPATAPAAAVLPVAVAPAPSPLPPPPPPALVCAA